MLLTPGTVVDTCIIEKNKACENLLLNIGLYILPIVEISRKRIIVRGKEENNCTRK